MKLLVLSLCLVAVLATERAQFERKRELENVLDDLANELEEIVAAEANKKGNHISQENTAVEENDDTEDFINSIINAKDDDEAFINLMRGENVVTVAEDGVQEDSLNALLDAQDLAHSDDNTKETKEMGDDITSDNVDHELQEMSGGNFDNDDSEDLFSDVLYTKEANKADEHVAGTMSDSDEDVVKDTSANKDDEKNGRLHNVNLMNDDEIQELLDQFADISNHNIETMSLNDENTQSGATDSLDNDDEMDDFLQLMEAMTGKGSTDDFREYLDLVEENDADDVGSYEKYLEEGNNDFIKSMSDVGGTDDTDDIDIGMMESSDDNEEDDSYLNNLLEFAQKLTDEESQDDENQDKENMSAKNDGAVAATTFGGVVLGRHTEADANVNSAGHGHHHHHRRHKHHRARRHHRRHKHHRARRHRRRHKHHRRHRRHRRHRHHRKHRHHRRHGHHRGHRRHRRHRLHKLRKLIRRFPIRRVLRGIPLGRIIRRIPARKILKKIRRKGKRLLRHLGHSLYYRRYHSLLKKYYHLRKKFYSLKSRHRNVKKACRKTTLKMVSNYCKKVRKKMNDYRKVYSKVRGCRNSRKCRFYEKTTNTTRNYYKFMYKLRPAAAMCRKLIEQSNG